MFSDPAVLNGGLFRENFFNENRKRNIELLMTGCAVNHLTADRRTPNRKDGKSVWEASFKKRLGQMPAVNFWNGLSLSCLPLF